MKADDLIAAGVPLSGNDAKAVLYAEAALDWMLENTTLEFDKNNIDSVSALPACAKLFIDKFSEISRRAAGMTSQSIEGMSMTFGGTVDSAGAGTLIWQYADMYLRPYMKSRVQFFPAQRRW